MSAIQISDLEIHGTVAPHRGLVKVEIIHSVSGKILGAGIIPLWCGDVECDGCGEAHGYGGDD